MRANIRAWYQSVMDDPVPETLATLGRRLQEALALAQKDDREGARSTPGKAANDDTGNSGSSGNTGNRRKR